MVLRKPYKFLIKHFRFIHLILAILSSYLLVKTNGILNFFNGYLNNNETLIGTGTVNEYFNSYMTIYIISIIIGTIIIGIIMKMKDKPIMFYIINLICYIIIGIIYAYDSSLITKLEVNVIDIRTIKLASDFTLICFLVQTLSTIILSVRAVGFNLKKFNFEKDMEFEIDEKDNEEFEFDVTIDKNKIKRNIKKNIRSIKYTYHENKFIANIIILISVILIVLFIYLNKEVYNKLYKKGELITTPQFTYSVVDSYLVNEGYRNNQITNNYLVVTKIKIKSNTQSKLNFETARLLLKIGKVSYNPTTKYKEQLIDLGTDIQNKNIQKEFNEYIIAFEIPKGDINEEMILNYTDINNQKYNIKLDSIVFNDKEVVKSSINEFIEINDKLLKNIKIKVNEIHINDKIQATYKFCETKELCYTSYEYIVPTLTDNYEKTIMRVKVEEAFGDETSKFKNVSDLIENYGTITYVVAENKKEMKTKIKEVIPTKSSEKGVYYFEVYKDIKNATEITLSLTVRNKTYEYKLK